MSNVLFAAPYAMDSTLRFVRAASTLPDVRLGLISSQALESFPEDLRERVVAYENVEDVLSADQLAEATERAARTFGGRVDRLIGILEQMQVPLAQVRERLGIRGMDSEEAHNFRDKSRMKQILRDNGLPCARHALAADREAALVFARECGYPLVAKPPAGAGARHTERVENDEQLTGYLKSQPPSASAPVLLEEFIRGREHSFDSVTLDRRHLFHSISSYHPSPLEVVESLWIQWCVLLPRRIDGPEYADMVETGRRALEVLGMVTGMSHMEWFRRSDGSLAISEVAARPPGAQFTSLISYAHDLDFYRAWARLVVEEKFEAPERKFACGAAYLRGQGSGKVVDVRGLEEVLAELGSLVVERKLPHTGQEPSGSYEGEGYVILRDRDTERVSRGLDRVVQSVRVVLG